LQNGQVITVLAPVIDFADRISNYTVAALLVIFLHYFVELEVSGVKRVVDKGWMLLVSKQLTSTENLFEIHLVLLVG
jgi:hypothetical protein